MKEQFFYRKNSSSLVFLIVCLIAIISSLLCCGCAKQDNNVSTYNNTPSQLSSDLFSSKISASTLAPNVSESVVGIEASIKGYKSIGTGVAVANNLIVSNEHVVNGVNTVTLYLKDGSSCKGEVIWTDNALDLSVIKTNCNLPYLPLLDKNSVTVGEDVIAIGTPIDLQFQHTVTKGIVSAVNRTVAVDTNYGESYLQDLIQHDASLNPGNSGGPLINKNGQVIGINTLKVDSAEGLGFAIPTQAAQNVINHIVSDGKYITPYIGVYGVDKNVSKFYGKDFASDGVIVNNLANNGPASTAGLKVGDIITSINGNAIHNMLDLRTELYASKVGDTALVEYIRDGNTSTLVITMAQHPQY